jgi:hypothetical protein
MFYIEISETEVLTTLSNISNSGGSIENCGCKFYPLSTSFNDPDTNGEFTIQPLNDSNVYDIQLYFTGVYFEVEPNW